jgi:hypothetical protein
LTALAAETESYDEFTVRQKGSKGAEKEARLIFSESGTTSDSDIREKEISEEFCEAVASIYFEFNTQIVYRDIFRVEV